MMACIAHRITVVGATTLAVLGTAAMLYGASAQTQAGPPAVGVVEAVTRTMTESSEVAGRVQAIGRVDLVARVTGFLEKQSFTEGAEVKSGDLLYTIEQGPYTAQRDAQAALLEQAKAQLINANATLSRAQDLYARNAGTQSAVDNALAAQRSAAAQVNLAEAQLRSAQINLDYTEIHSPIDGRIGRTSVTTGNVVGPNSSVLATVVSQDPMYVLFPVSARRILDLTEKEKSKGGQGINIRLRLANGQMFDQVGKLDFIDISVAQDTDTIMLRGVIPNPAIPTPGSHVGNVRLLTNNAFVTVVLESVEPTEFLAVPRAAILSDQLGDYVFIVDSENKAQQRRVKLGQSTPTVAAVLGGLKVGDKVIVEGIQRVRPGALVAPGPASPSAASAIEQGENQ